MVLVYIIFLVNIQTKNDLAMNIKFIIILGPTKMQHKALKYVF